MKEHHINFVLNATTYLISQLLPCVIRFQMISLDILIFQRTFELVQTMKKSKILQLRT